jgi:hypothetical protein
MGGVPTDPLTGEPFDYTPPEDPSLEGRLYQLTVPPIMPVILGDGPPAPAATE